MPTPEPALRPMVTPHPVVIIVTLVVVGALVVLALNPEFRPRPLLFVAVAVFLIMLNQWSRARRAKPLREQEKVPAEKIESRL